MTANLQSLPSAGLPEQDLLRVMTCGSVDDGKSTLIGRLLLDSDAIFDDHIAQLRRDSRRYGTAGDELDPALLLDGLEAERNQGITIDVAYRFFRSAHRSFILADTPGHLQYTRNTATAASNSDAAIVLIDAQNGLVQQTRRHSFICALFGVRHVVLAVNKMDLVGHDCNRFAEIVAAYQAFSAELHFASVTAIPLSARFGDSIRERSERMAWYTGPTLLEYLDTIEVASDRRAAPFRFPVQWINRHDSFRGAAGSVVSGSIRVGDVVSSALGCTSAIERIVTADGDRDNASAGDAVTLVLSDDVDLCRGDLLATASEQPAVSDRFSAHLLWLDDEALRCDHPYWLRTGARWLNATIIRLNHAVDVDTLQPVTRNTLFANDIGVCDLTTSVPIAFDCYRDNRDTGAFILVDRLSNLTVAAGMIDRSIGHHPKPASDTHSVATPTIQRLRPVVVWLTGLSGAGKSTIATLACQRLRACGCGAVVLDGDDLRTGLNKDLGFSREHRAENVRRTAEVAKLLMNTGLVVLCSLIAPFESDRRMARSIIGADDFIEVFVDTPLDECKQRDPKGLYQRARRHELHNFTGIDSPYESPSSPDIHIITSHTAADAAARFIIDFLWGHYFAPSSCELSIGCPPGPDRAS